MIFNGIVIVKLILLSLKYKEHLNKSLPETRGANLPMIDL